MNHKIFPFAPGVRYPLKYGNYIDPKMSLNDLNNFLDKEVVIYCHGGILESFFSLSFAEAYQKLKPEKRIFWSGKEDFKPIIEINKICKYVKVDINIDQYPVPLFLNKERTHCIFNVLNNYLDVKNIKNEVRFRSTKSFAKQIFSNSFLEWDTIYVPKIRSEIPEELSEWMRNMKLKPTDSFILLFPDETKWGFHKDNICLDWSARDVRSFGSMLTNTQYKLLICTHNPSWYYGTRCHFPPMKPDVILWLTRISDVILSREADYLMLGVFLSNGMSFSNKVGNEFGWKKNSKYLKLPWNIEYIDDVRPINIYDRIII